MRDLETIKAIDLPGFLARTYGVEVGGSGAALCPFHEDTNPSLSVFQKNGTWGWTCHGCGAKGTILDFVMKKEGLSLGEAADRIGELEGLPGERRPASKPGPKITRVHSYTDEQGVEWWQKVKLADGSFRCRREEAGTWIYKDALKAIGPMRDMPYRLHKIVDEKAVIVCEGEHDADTLAALGYAATSGPAGKDTWHDETTTYFKGKSVCVIYDVGQDEAAQAVATKLSAVCERVVILHVPLPNKEDDITDYLGQFADDEEKRIAFEQIVAAGEVFGRPEPDFLMLSDVEAQRYRWVWENYFAEGYATLVSADPGVGKTYFLLDSTSRLSKGLPWPDGAPGGEAAQTVYLTVEDGLHDTIRPRIDSLGGDPKQIAVFNSEHPLHLDLSKPEGLVRLERNIVRLGRVKLVVVDPIIDFSGGSNPNAAEEVRSLLTPLIRMAARLHFALILIGHLNKAQTMSAIYRAGGSTSGWLGKCRAAFMVFRDQEDKDLRHVIPIKANLAPEDPKQLHFRIKQGRVEYEESTGDVDVDEQLSPKRSHGPAPDKCDEAVAWLTEFFAERNEIPTTEVEEAAGKKKISAGTLARAKKAGGYRAGRVTESGGRQIWTWVKKV